MTSLEEVKKMQEQGIPENEIIQSLQERGFKYKEISEALSQSRIKAAVEEPTSETPTQEAPQVEMPSGNSQEAIPGMQKSMLEAPAQEAQIQAASQIGETAPEGIAPETEYVPQAPVEGQYEYPAYEQSSAGISADVITEISEQVVSEKLSEIRKHIEKVIDFKTTIEAKTDAVEERLKRIEKVIDTLQTSVLRKVGDYVTNVEDIKKELIETQKSFSKLVPEIRKKTAKKISKK